MQARRTSRGRCQWPAFDVERLEAQQQIQQPQHLQVTVLVIFQDIHSASVPQEARCQEPRARTTSLHKASPRGTPRYFRLQSPLPALSPTSPGSARLRFLTPPAIFHFQQQPHGRQVRWLNGRASDYDGLQSRLLEMAAVIRRFQVRPLGGSKQIRGERFFRLFIYFQKTRVWCLWNSLAREKLFFSEAPSLLPP
ncbi:hypothetical protein VTI74DRAFT_10993 [Chaetomium olivicolor]